MKLKKFLKLLKKDGWNTVDIECVRREKSVLTGNDGWTVKWEGTNQEIWFPHNWEGHAEETVDK